jgi:hypothetical protein
MLGKAETPLGLRPQGEYYEFLGDENVSFKSNLDIDKPALQTFIIQ